MTSHALDPTALERLLIDRELGELSPDVAALLDAYLALRPADQALRTQVRSTLNDLQAALAAPSRADQAAPTEAGHATRAASSPSLPPLRAARRRNWRRLSVMRPLAAAALIALAFFAGARSTAVRPAADNRSPAPVSLAASAGDFWSIQRLRQNHRLDSPTPGAAGLRWTSPVSLPTPGEGS